MFGFASGISLGGKFVLFLLGIVLIIAIPNMSEISEKLGFETKASLRKELTKLKMDKELADSQVESIKKDLELEKQKNKDLERTRELNEENKKEISSVVNKHVSVLVPVKRTKINAGMKGIDMSKSEHKSAEELSLENITTVWKAYCELNSISSCPV